MPIDTTDLPAAFSYATARAAGVSDRRLRTLVEDGALIRIGYGAYRKSDAPLVDLDLVEIALRAPDATLCLTSALARHELADVIPSAVDVALPRTRRPPRVEAPTRWHRFEEDTFVLGRQAIEVDDGVFLGLYSPERSLVDAFRLRHLEGEDLAIEALRRWLRRPGAIPADLLSLARAFPKGEPALREALRMLL